MIGPVPHRRTDDEGERKIDQRWGRDIADLAPIEPWVGNQNAPAAHRQADDAQGNEPMGDADESAMPRRRGVLYRCCKTRFETHPALRLKGRTKPRGIITAGMGFLQPSVSIAGAG